MLGGGSVSDRKSFSVLLLAGGQDLFLVGNLNSFIVMIQDAPLPAVPRAAPVSARS